MEMCCVLYPTVDQVQAHGIGGSGKGNVSVIEKVGHCSRTPEQFILGRSSRETPLSKYSLGERVAVEPIKKKSHHYSFLQILRRTESKRGFVADCPESYP